MIELKFHGLGGQGVVTAGEVLSVAVSLHGNGYAITIPAYGHERRGAPVSTSIIVDDKPILINSFVYNPDIVLIMDYTVIQKGIDISKGIHKDSILVLNTEDEQVLDIYKKCGFKKIYYVDATRIALANIGNGIPNSAMLGALAGTGLLKVELIQMALMSTFNTNINESNAKAAKIAYEKIKIA